MKKWLIILLGIFLMSISLTQFLEPYAIVIGGATGIGIIFKQLFNIPLSLTNIVVNIPLFILAIKIKGFSFVRDTLIATILLSIMLEITAFIPEIKTDIILTAIFGGLLNGIGVGLILRGNTTTGGSDLLAVILHHFYPHIPTARIMLILDILIVVAGIFALGITPALYAIVAIYIMGKIIDIFFEGINFTKLMIIVSNKSEEIAKQIDKKVARGSTGLYGKGMYTNENKLILMCAAYRKDVARIKIIAKEIDPKSFIVITNSREVVGQGFKN